MTFASAPGMDGMGGVAGTVTEVPAYWVPVAVAALLVVAAAAAVLDGFGAARVGGTSTAAGLRRPLTQVARLLRQRRRVPVSADVLLWRIGGASLLVAAMSMIVVVPLGGWTLADLSVGLVWFNAMDILVWAAVWLAGWGANSFLSLVGGNRFLALALSYELPLMFAIIAPAVGAASLRMSTIVTAQQDLWFVVWMPAAFLVFCLCVLAFSVWGPLGTPAGTDVAGGVLVEASGIDRLLLLAGRYALLVAGSAVGVTIFLGGGAGPLLPDWLWVIVKTLALLAVLVLLRRRLPAVRPDRFAEVGWLVLLPLTLIQLLVVSVIVLGG